MLCISTCRLHAVATHNTEDFIYNHVDGHLKEVGLTDVRARDLVDVVMGYTGNGYAHSTQEELGESLSLSLSLSLSPPPPLSLSLLHSHLCVHSTHPFPHHAYFRRFNC